MDKSLLQQQMLDRLAEDPRQIEEAERAACRLNRPLDEEPVFPKTIFGRDGAGAVHLLDDDINRASL